MVSRPPNPLAKIIRRLSGRQGNIDSKHVKDALHYIEDYWSNLIHEESKDHGTIIGLPYPYVVPANDPKHKFTFKEQYYWDSYLTAIGLVDTRRQELAEGMLENLLYLFKRFHFVPNASRMYFMSHSQPPVLTSYIRLIYETGGKDHKWLKDRMELAEKEYTNVWTSEEHPFWHKIHRGLSRYYDIHVLHDLAEAESGWDMTTRFERKCLDYLPIDLNCLLYKYETDFAWASELLGDDEAVKTWKARAAHRRGEVNRLMWHRRKGFYFDYNFSKKQPGDVWSLAGFYPLWAGLATEDQAARLVKHLAKFEHAGGLVTTTRPLLDMSIFGSLKTQWSFPNGWAPLNWIVIEGLRQYGYEEEAVRIARKWLHSNLFWFERHGEFLEKYNVVRPHNPPVEGLYPGQTGFGWTNAIFVYLARQYLGEEV